jgi:transposase
LNEQEDPKTLHRQRVILEHWSGRISATEAALEMGVSRKTFYQWMERGLSAMRSALRDRPGGRPSKPADPEAQRLQEEVETLEKERLVLESRLRIQEVIRETLGEMRPERPPKKKRAV